MTTKIILLITLIAISALPLRCDAESADKPIQHYQVSSIESRDEAVQVFSDKTLELQQRKDLSAKELQEIHEITYSLEKAVAFFVENTSGELRTSAGELAQIVELIHLSSENNRSTETKKYLTQYFELADLFATKL